MKRREFSTPATEARRGRFTGLLFAGVVLLVGFTVVLSVYAGMRGVQSENADRVMDQRTAVARAAVQTETERYRSLVETAAAGLATDPDLTWEGFDAATAPLASANLVGAASLAFVVPVEGARIAAAQRHWRSRGAEGLTLRPALTRSEHFFTIFTRSLGPTGSPLSGLDLTAAPEPAAALEDSRELGRPSVSDTYVLLRDRTLPAAQQQRSFVFAAPIWTRANVPEFRGWVVLGLRGEDFLEGMLATVSQGQLDGLLLSTDRDGSESVVAEYRVPGDADLRRSVSLSVADREWTLVTRADASHLPGASSTLPMTLLLTGGAMSVLLAGLIYVLATGRARAEARVHKATAELRVAEEESRRQARLLGAILASISDAVTVVDENNALLLNPAARALLGMAEDEREESDPNAWHEHYGLFQPDGRTPFAVGDYPLVRALRGESSDGVEMIVRNSRRPEGILVSMDGRPFDAGDGRPGAVAVLHDITELRRYENDLAVFAGVVAHDLKAPLSVIRGHSEAVSDELADAPDGPEVDGARRSLGRIIHAVDRMAGLIDTLLAYSTARDAPLRTRPVDLAALVADVVHDRTAHLRPEDQPDIVVGPLPGVTADPSMLRHVLDNLLGNALKYVRPGTMPRVDVTGDVDAAGWTRVEVADRGIGIPDDAKPDIFDSFHRAHAEAGYAGTGLGLAICKRIVERHGGEIGVADNPGGGTRFHFTMPTSEQPTSRQPASEQPSSRQPASEQPTSGRPGSRKPAPAEPEPRRRAMTAPDPTEDEEAATRAALERALAERAVIEDSRLPGLAALPAADPSAHDPAAARLRDPVPGHHSSGRSAE